MKEFNVFTERAQLCSSIVVGSGAVKRLDSDSLFHDRSKIAFVIDSKIRSAFSDLAPHAFLERSCEIALHGGESVKQLESVGELWQQFAQCGVDRSSLIVAVGGGALSDLVGFAAATFMRGVPWMIVPTTLLAQVDAAIGGKTAVNIGGVKNLAGAFHHPDLVLVDPRFLDSLPEREYRAGLAEVIKIGLVADAALVSYFERCNLALRKVEGHVIDELIAAAVHAKVRIVNSDPLERGPRALLNFGHTVAHAVEAVAARHGVQVLHGEAVALGILAESIIAREEGFITVAAVERIRALIERTQLPVEIAGNLPMTQMLEAIESDKKSKAGVVRWTLLHDVGQGVIGCQPASTSVRCGLTAIGIF